MRFFDTNVLVYAASDQDERKRDVAEDLNEGQLYCGMVVVNPFRRHI